MNIIALLLAVIAAVVFVVVHSGYGGTQGRGRGSIAAGLFFLTLALIVQFCAESQTVTF